MRFLYIIFFFVIINTVYAQKIEIEKGVSEDEIPEIAFEYITSRNVSKYRWFKEESESGITYEAKFKHNKRKFSVEFSEKGQFEDIEISIAKSEIAEESKSRIEKALSAEFEKYKISKVQIQYKTIDLKELLSAAIPKLDAPHIYEIVVKGKKGKSQKLWEFQFNYLGELISFQEIVLRNKPYLEY